MVLVGLHMYTMNQRKKCDRIQCLQKTTQEHPVKNKLSSLGMTSEWDGGKIQVALIHFGRQSLINIHI